MTLLHHIYAIKNLLARGNASDDFSFSERLIAHFLEVARGKLILDKINKYKFVSDQSYQDLCVALQESVYHDCCDVIDFGDCKLLKSIDPLPKFLNSAWGNFLKVTDLSGNVISELTLTQNTYSKYAIIKPKTGWFLHNNHLYVLNNTGLRKVLLNALFSNPQEIYDTNCTTGTGKCVEYLAQEFPVDADLMQAMYELTLKLLLGTKLPNDLENNARDIQIAGPQMQ